MSDEYRLPGDAHLLDDLSVEEVWEAIRAPAALRRENRVPIDRPSFLALCAPTDVLRLVVVLCRRDPPERAWTVVAARDATMSERAMWREGTA